MTTPSRAPDLMPISWYAIVLLIGHLLLAGTSAWSLWLLGSGLWLGLGAAVVSLLGYAALWRLRLAPVAHRRFNYKERLTTHLILGPALIVLAVLGKVWIIAMVGLSLVLLGDALAARSSDDPEAV